MTKLEVLADSPSASNDGLRFSLVLVFLVLISLLSSSGFDG